MWQRQTVGHSSFNMDNDCEKHKDSLGFSRIYKGLLAGLNALDGEALVMYNGQMQCERENSVFHHN